MKDNDRNFALRLSGAFILFLAGIAIRYSLGVFVKYAYYITLSAIILSALKSIFIFFTERKFPDLCEGIIHTILALIFIIKPFSILLLIKFACSIYFLMLSAVHIIAFLKMYHDTKRIRYGIIIMFTTEIIFAHNIFFNGNHSIAFLGKLLGTYLIIYSVSLISDYLTSKSALRKRKFHIPLPNLISAFIPRRILNKINKAFQEDNIPGRKINRNKSNDYQIEVFIHMSDTLFGQVGHVDICYRGHVISYGSYDESSYRLGGMIGDGVVEIVDRAKYIRFCLEESHKHIVSFGIRLLEAEEILLQKKLLDIYENLSPWHPPITECEGKILTSARYELDYASSLYEKTNAKFYKFNDGPYSKFKTYFALFTNCATLAEEITSEIGISLFDIRGILTPGSFYNYLNGEYGRENSFVVSRNLYAIPKK